MFILNKNKLKILIELKYKIVDRFIKIHLNSQIFLRVNFFFFKFIKT
jgi:hypothetical protein